MSKDIQWGMQVSLTGDDVVQGQFKKLDKTVDGAADSLDDVAQSSDKAGDKLQKAGKDAEDSGKKSKKAQSWWKQLTNEFFSIKGIIAGLSFGLLTSQIIDVGNVTQGWAVGMEAVTGSHAVAQQELQNTRDLAEKLGLDIRSSTNSYIQFSAATQDTALQGAKTTKVFDAVSTAMRVLNRSADDTAGALKALEQMVSKGNVQAEELRGQLGERLPGAFNLAAKAMGVTTQELNKMLEQGQVLAADLLPKLADALQEKYGPALAKAINNPAQAFRNLSNATFKFYEGLSNAAFETLASGAQLLADALNGIIPYLPIVIGGLTSLVKIIAVSGALYLGYIALSTIIPIVTVAINGYGFASIRLQAALVAAAIKQKFFNGILFQTVTQVGLLKSAMIGLAALYAGWEIGSLLSENFLEARLAGFAFVRAMEVGFTYLSFAFDSTMAAITYSWESSLNGMKEFAASFYNTIGNALQTIGADDLSKIYKNAAAGYTASIKPVSDLTEKLNELSGKRDEDIAQIDKTILSLVDHEIAVSKGAKTLSADTDAKKKNNTETVTTISENQKLIASIQQEIDMLGKSAKEKLVLNNLSKLSSDASKEEIAEVRKKTEALFDQQKVIDLAKEDDDFYKNAIDGVNGYSDAWASAGNVIIETFGTIGQQVEKLLNTQDAYTKAIDINHDKQKVQGADIKKLKAEELKLNDANTQAQLNSYSAMAGAVGKMFNENSKAAKAAHAIEQGLAIASLAMSVEKMLMSSTETAAVVANEGVKQVALGTTAIITQGQGDPYTAWGRIAAMIALVASLGIATSGGSSSSFSLEDKQDNQNTGTVFGDSDAKSNSLGNSFDRIEELELDQYAELQQMNASLRSLNQNITRLAISLIGSYGKFDEQSYGGELGSKSSTSKLEELLLGGVWGQVAKALDPTGIVGKIFSSFSKTKKTLLDSGISIVGQTMGEIIESGMVNAQAYYDVETKKTSFWGLKKKYSTDTEYQDLGDSFNKSFGLVFSDIASSINQAVDILGLDVAKETTNFQSNLRNVLERKGMFEPADFEEFFDNFNDGLVEGATRSLENFKINLPKISFKDMSGEEIEQELQAMVSNQADLMAQYLVPQIAKFQQVGEGLYETLIRVAQEQAIFNNAMEAMGHSISDVAGMTKEVETEIAQAIIGLMGGLDNFREYTSTYFNEFLSDDEQFDYLKNNLNELFAGLEQTLPATRDEFKALIGSIDITTESGQALYAALSALFGPLDQYYDELERNKEQIIDTAQAELDLAQSRADFVADIATQLSQLDMSPFQIKLANLQKEFNDYRDEAGELGADTALLEQLYAKKRTAIIEDALSAINSAHERSVSTLVANNQRLQASFSSLNASISRSILDIRRQGSNWNEVSYQSDQVSSLTDLLGQGTVEDQLTNIGNLQQAYTDQYNAQLSEINASRDAAQNAHDNRVAQMNERYQIELDAYNSIMQSIEALKAAADDLLLSDYSTLTNQQRFDEAQAQFNSMLSRANAGDAEALSQLGSSGNNYLKEAQSFYASGSDYTNIFDQVYSALNGIGSQSVLAPTKPVEPIVPAAIYRHNSDIKALQESTVEKLLELKELTAELEAQSESEFDIAMNALNEQLAIDTDVINAELIKQSQLIDEQLTVLQQLPTQLELLNRTIYDAGQTPPIVVIKPPAPMIHPPKPEDDKNNELMLAQMTEMNASTQKQVQLLEQRAQQAEQQNERSTAELIALQKSFQQSTKASERKIDELENQVRSAR